MKRTVPVILTLVVMLTLSACRTAKETSSDPGTGLPAKTGAIAENLSAAEAPDSVPDEAAPVDSSAAASDSHNAGAQADIPFTPPAEPGCAHSYSAADCTAAAVCTKCGKTGSAPLGHDFYAGMCRRCQADDPDYTRFYPEDKSFSIAISKKWAGEFGVSGYQENELKLIFGQVDYGYTVAFPVGITVIDNEKVGEYVSDGGCTLAAPVSRSEEYALIQIASNARHTALCEYINQPGWLEGPEEEVDAARFVLNHKQEIIDSFRWENANT